MNDVDLFNYLQDKRTDTLLKYNKVERDIKVMVNDPYRIEPMYKGLKKDCELLKVELELYNDLLKDGISLDLMDKTRQKTLYYQDKITELDYKIRHTYVRQYSNPNYKKDAKRLEKEKETISYKLETIKKFYK